MTSLAILNIGPFEILIVAAAAVMLFGGDLPQTARKAAQMVARLRGIASDLGKDLTQETGGRKPFLPQEELKRLAGLEEDPEPHPGIGEAAEPDDPPPVGEPVPPRRVRSQESPERDPHDTGWPHDGDPDEPVDVDWRPADTSPPPEAVALDGDGSDGSAPGDAHDGIDAADDDAERPRD